MKRISLLLFFALSFSAASFAYMSESKTKSLKKQGLLFATENVTNINIANKNNQFQTEETCLLKKHLVNQYYWILMADGCYYLGRVNEPGYTDETGYTHTGYSLTWMNASNYHGPVQNCPPTGVGYC